MAMANMNLIGAFGLYKRAGGGGGGNGGRRRKW